MMIPGHSPNNNWSDWYKNTIKTNPYTISVLPFWSKYTYDPEQHAFVEKQPEEVKTRKKTVRARCLLCGYSRKLRADGALVYHTLPHNYTYCYGSRTKYHVPVEQLTPEEVGKLAMLV